MSLPPVHSLYLKAQPAKRHLFVISDQDKVGCEWVTCTSLLKVDPCPGICKGGEQNPLEPLKPL